MESNLFLSAISLGKGWSKNHSYQLSWEKVGVKYIFSDHTQLVEKFGVNQSFKLQYNLGVVGGEKEISQIGIGEQLGVK